jgi:hypothetical protein
MILNKSLVEFDEEHHIYTYNGKELSGITGMLHRLVFPDMYKNVDETTLKRAAEKGTRIHQTLEILDDMGLEAEIPEEKTYKRLLKANKLCVEATEYTVSDYEHYASRIDKVFRVDDKTFDLGDIKTTYTLNAEYVRWQLSIYAMLFERNNPHCSVRRLYAIWLRGDEGKLVEVERIPSDVVFTLMHCDQLGKPFKNPLLKFPKDLVRMTSRMAHSMRQRDYWTAEVKEYQSLLKRRMEECQTYKWDSHYVTAVRSHDTEVTTFDAKAFAKDYPELYKKYLKSSCRQGFVTIRVKEQQPKDKPIQEEQ